MKTVNDYYNLFYYVLYAYIKMVNKHYQKAKKSFKKKDAKGTKIFLNKKNKKCVSITEIKIKIFLKEKSKRKLSI